MIKSEFLTVAGLWCDTDMELRFSRSNHTLVRFPLLSQDLVVVASGMHVILDPLLDHMAFLNQLGCLNSFHRLFKNT